MEAKWKTSLKMSKKETHFGNSSLPVFSFKFLFQVSLVDSVITKLLSYYTDYTSVRWCLEKCRLLQLM